jgi:hypothetical protein
MKKLNFHLYSLLSLSFLFSIVSCQTETKKINQEISLQEKAKVSITNWVKNNKEEYHKYKPLSFEEFTPRYERTELTHYLLDKIEEEKTQPKVNKHKLDSLTKLLDNNKGLLLGYTIIHRYQTVSVSGEVVKHEDLVFLDTAFRVATILNPDAYDMILDQKLIFKLDSLKKK